MSYTKKQLIAALRELEAHQAAMNPDFTWVKKNRDFLLSKIKGAAILHEHGIRIFQKVWEGFAVVFPGNAVYSVVRPVVTVVVVASLAAGGWISTVTASQNALPGDMLYNVKIASEGAHLAITQVTADRATVAALRAERASRRIDEARQLSRRTVTAADSAANIKEIERTVTKAQKEMSAIQSDLEDAQRTSSVAAAAVAKVVSRDIGNVQREIKSARAEFATTIANEADKASVVRTVLETERLALVAETTAIEVALTQHLGGDQSIALDDVKKQVVENLDKVGDAEGVSPEGRLALPMLIKEGKERLEDQDLNGVLAKVRETRSLVSGDAEAEGTDDTAVSTTTKLTAPDIIIEDDGAGAEDQGVQ